VRDLLHVDDAPVIRGVSLCNRYGSEVYVETARSE